MFTYALMVVSTMLLASLVVCVVFSLRKIHKMKQERDTMFNGLYKTIEKTNKEKDVYKKRCIEIEDSMKSKTRVSIRKEIVNIDVQFNKFELVMILNSVDFLMKNKRNISTDDVKIYISFMDKINSVIGKIKEEDGDCDRYKD